MHPFSFLAFLASLCAILRLWQVSRELLTSLPLFMSRLQRSACVPTHPTHPFDFPTFLAHSRAVLRLWQVTQGLLTFFQVFSSCLHRCAGICPQLVTWPLCHLPALRHYRVRSRMPTCWLPSITTIAALVVAITDSLLPSKVLTISFRYLLRRDKHLLIRLLILVAGLEWFSTIHPNLIIWTSTTGQMGHLWCLHHSPIALALQMCCTSRLRFHSSSSFLLVSGESLCILTMCSDGLTIPFLDV